MRQTVREWRDEWIETNGETDEMEVLIEDGCKGAFNPYIYEGSFAGVSEEHLDKKVIECGQIIDSSEPERIGAYTLMI